MRIRRERRYAVQMGSFETYSFGTAVELSHYDLGFSDDQWAALDDEDRQSYTERLRSGVLEELTEQLKGEIEDSVYLTRSRKSFIHEALEIQGENDAHGHSAPHSTRRSTNGTGRRGADPTPSGRRRR